MRDDVRRVGWIGLVGVAIAVTMAPALLSAQDLTLRGTTTVRGKETPTVTYISAVGTRSPTGDGNEVILRLDQKKVYLLNNRQKTYNEVTFDDLEKMATAATQGMENLPPEAAAQMKKMMGGMMGDVTVTPAGPGESIAGYATEKYHVTMGTAMEMDMWVAPALPIPPQYYDAMKAAAANPMFDMRKMFDEFKKVKGMQLKSVSNVKMMGQSMTTTTVVNTVDKAPIPPGTFDVPAGFKAVTMK